MLISKMLKTEFCNYVSSWNADNVFIYHPVYFQSNGYFVLLRMKNTCKHGEYQTQMFKNFLYEKVRSGTAELSKPKQSRFNET